MGILLKIKGARIPGPLLNSASGILARGGVLVYPTDTIYGLGCDALRKSAVQKIFEIKQRPRESPALVLVRTVSMLRTLVEEVPPLAVPLMREFWPGPLTLLFPARRGLHSFIVSHEGKIGIRIPANRFCLRLMGVTGRPLLSTSVNRSGRPEETRIDRIREQFLGCVDAIVDAGDLSRRVPSTVVDTTGTALEILREGVIPARRILTLGRAVRGNQEEERR